MIKLIFNRFQEIPINIVTKSDPSGLKQAANEAKNLKKEIQDISNVLVNPKGLDETAKKFNDLTNKIKSTSGIQSLQNSLGSKLSSANMRNRVFRTIGNKKVDAVPSLGGVDKLRTMLPELGTIPSIFDASSLSNIDAAKQKSKELNEHIKNTAINWKEISKTPVETTVSSLMSGYNMFNTATGNMSNIPTALDPNKIKQVSDMMKELNAHAQETVNDLYKGFGKTDDSIKKTNVSFSEFLNNLKKAPSLVDALSKGFNSLNIVKLTYLFRAVKRVTSTMVSMVENAAGYEESLNLYMMALGKYADRATDWSDRITDALKLDPADVMKYTGALYNLTKGLGVSSDAAYIMGTNLTQLTYDMASYLNISNDAAFAKIQSAMAGQSRAVATVGVATQMASLQELAIDLGIKKKVKDMTQAEKTYLRYIQLMKNTTQMQGDLGRTMITPANAIRTLKNQINLLSRSIGQVMTPIIMQAIPYIMAFTNVLSRAAQALAKFFGYNLTEVDYSSSLSFEDAAEGADNLDKLGSSAAGAAKKINNSLAPFDDLNVVLTENAGAGAGGGSGSISDTIDPTVWDKLLPEYNMLKDYTGELVRQAKDLEDNIARIGVALGIVIGMVKIAEWIKKIAELKSALSELGPVATAAFKVFTGAGMMFGGHLIFDSLIDSFLNAESEIMTIGERIRAGLGTEFYILGGALAGSIAGPIGTITGAAVGFLAAFTDIILQANDAEEIAKLGLKRIRETSDAILDCSKQLEGITGPLDYNIKSVEKLYGNYDKLVSSLDSVVDESGKVKKGHEAEAKTIVEQLNEALGMNIKIQDGQIKNYQNIRNEIGKTLEAHRRESTVKAYYEKYSKTLTEVDTATKSYTEAITNLWQARVKEAKAAQGTSRQAYLDAVDNTSKAQEAYDAANEQYKSILADKAKYEALYVAQSQEDWDKVDDIIKNSAYTQTYWVGQALIGMTNEVNGPLGEDLLIQWQQLATDDEKAFNEAIKQIGNEDTRKFILGSMNVLGDELITQSTKNGQEAGDAYSKSYQEVLDSHPVAIMFDGDTGREFATDQYGVITEVFSNPIDVSLKEENNTWKNMRSRLKNYFANNPVTLSGELSWASSLASKAGDKIRAALNFKANGGFVDSGDLFFANENGRSEFITHVGGHAAVANQDQMIQALSNAIMAGFSMYNGGKSGSTTVYIGNDKVYEGQGRYQSRQTDRYGTSVINV